MKYYEDYEIINKDLKVNKAMIECCLYTLAHKF